KVVLHVVMGQVKIGIGAVENNHVEAPILLDQADQFSEFHHRRRRDCVDGRVVERHPHVAGTAAVNPEMRPGPGGAATADLTVYHEWPPIFNGVLSLAWT